MDESSSEYRAWAVCAIDAAGEVERYFDNDEGHARTWAMGWIEQRRWNRKCRVLIQHHRGTIHTLTWSGRGRLTAWVPVSTSITVRPPEYEVSSMRQGVGGSWFFRDQEAAVAFAVQQNLDFPQNDVLIVEPNGDTWGIGPSGQFEPRKHAWELRIKGASGRRLFPAPYLFDNPTEILQAARIQKIADPSRIVTVVDPEGIERVLTLMPRWDYVQPPPTDSNADASPWSRWQEIFDSHGR